jgi:hypothetical protein
MLVVVALVRVLETMVLVVLVEAAMEQPLVTPPILTEVLAQLTEAAVEVVDLLSRPLEVLVAPAAQVSLFSNGLLVINLIKSLFSLTQVSLEYLMVSQLSIT